MLVVIAQLGTPDLVGQFALGLAITAPIILFANLHLRAVQATDARREYSFGDYFGLRLATTALALVAITLVTILSGYRSEPAFVIVLVGVAKAIEALSDLVFGLMQQRERMDRIARSLMIRGPLTLVAISLVLYAAGGIVVAVAGMALVWAVVFVFYDLPNAARLLHATEGVTTRLRPIWHLPTLRRLTLLALPLGFTMMVISLTSSIPRYYLESYHGESQLGIFAALAYFVVVGNTVVSALGQASSPRLSVKYAQGKRVDFSLLLLKLIGVAVVIGVVGLAAAIFVGEWLLTVLYGVEYAVHTGAFVVVMVAAGLSYVASFLGYGMTAARCFRAQLVLFGAAAGLCLLLSQILIPDQGIAGAARVLLWVFGFQLVASVGVTLLALRSFHRKAVEANER